MNLLIQNNLFQIKQIFLKHRVIRAYIFGSVCTDKFNDKSDIDFIIAFDQRYFDGYVENYFELEDELRNLLNRNVDLVTEETIQNPYFKIVVNKTKTPIYE